MEGLRVRRAEDSDVAPAYAVFRRAIYAYLATIGLVEAEQAKNPPIESAWQRQRDWITHLWNTAIERWVACDDTGKVVGWAMSVQRGSHMELTHFFVDPGFQGRGLGRVLLERAFPALPWVKRSIMATQDPRALATYLNLGLTVHGTSVDFMAKVWTGSEPTDLTFARLTPGDAAVAAIGAIEARVLGLRRDADIAFLLSLRPAWLALRNGAPVGYVFGLQPNPPEATDFDPVCGPMAALDPADIPALIDQMMTEPGGTTDFSIALPLANRTGIAHMLKRGARIDPFFVVVLADDGTLQLDRYVHTAPSFIL